MKTHKLLNCIVLAKNLCYFVFLLTQPPSAGIIGLLHHTQWFYILKFIPLWDWRDGLIVKRVCCSFRGPGFNSQHPFCGSQGNLMPFHFCRLPGKHVVHIHACRQNTQMHKINLKNFKSGYLCRSQQPLTQLEQCLWLLRATPKVTYLGSKHSIPPTITNGHWNYYSGYWKHAALRADHLDLDSGSVTST